MRLREALPLRQLVQKPKLSRQDIKRYLMDRGWQLAGSGGKYQTPHWRPNGEGFYATVMTNPKTNYALKIVTVPNPCYLRFVRFCMNNQSNPFLPRFLDRKVLQIPGQPGFAIRMELLKPPGVDLLLLSQYEQIAKHFEYYALEWFFPIPPEGQLYDMKLVWQTYYRNEKGVKDMISPELLRFGDKRPVLFKTLAQLGEMARKTHCHIDLHERNWMSRQDGQLVITDPFKEQNEK